MNLKLRFLLLLFTLGVALGDSSFCLAQEVRDETWLKSSQQQGQVLVVVFKNGLPAESIEIQTPIGPQSTNQDGVLSFQLKAKNDYQLIVNETEQIVKFSVRSQQETQITIHLSQNNNISQVENPTEQATSKPVLQNAELKDLSFSIKNIKGRPLSEVQVIISGVESLLKSDQQGLIKTKLPMGNYVISLFHPDYQSQTLADIEVKNEAVEIPVVLKESLNELEDVIVLAPKSRGSLSSLVEVRKQSSAVTDGLGSEQMSRAGDSDAAASLRRVTGLTLVGGKYVYVRGLGERYSGVLMNRFSLPSPEPARRVVPLDLFPTAIMESIVVQKSYSPDLPGEFGGGLIQLQTKSIPEKFYFKANLSNNFDNSSNRLNSFGGSTDHLGFDDGSRQLPDAIKNVLKQGLQIEKNIPGFDKGLSEERVVELSQSLGNTYNTNRTSSPSLPGLAFSMGTGRNFKGLKTGISAGGLYGQNIDQYNREIRGFNVGNQGRLEADFERQSDVAEVETRVAGHLDFGLDFYKHTQIRLSSFILRNTTQLTQNDLSQNFGSGGNYTDSTVLDFIERQLFTQHLSANHDFSSLFSRPLKVDWRLGLSQALRDSPDRREYLYDIINSSKTIASDSAGNRRTWSELQDNSTEIAINSDFSILKSDPEYLKVKFGALLLNKDRQSDITRLYFANDYNGTAPIDLGASPEVLFNQENRKPGLYLLKNLTNSADSYSGEQNLSAQYIMFDFSPQSDWSFQSGVRQETSIQEVNTYKYFEPNNPFATSRLKMMDTLPAHSVVWKPNEKIRGRLAYSETLARPDFRELSTVGFIDDETGLFIQGNANLKGTVIKNIDHRWEYYLSNDEYTSVGFFYKNFINPIEVVFLPGVNRIQSFDNADSADNYGVEVESRFSLRHLSRSLRRFSFLSNITLIESNIKLDAKNSGIQTSSERPLQGQSPYVLNAQLQYDLPTWGLSSTLLYNIVGPRITEVGTNGIPDTYEQAFGQLDFVASKVIDKNWFVGFRARNLLNPKVNATQDTLVVRSFNRGRVFSVNLGAVF